VLVSRATLGKKNAMNEALKSQFQPVKDEVYQLLLTACCYRTKLTMFEERLQRETREFILEEVTALRHMANGIIMHLCALDDDDSKWSLRSLRKALAGCSEFCDRMDRCNRDLKAYRSALGGLKNGHRNAYIAHRNSDGYPDLFEFHDFQKDVTPLISSAVSLFQTLWGDICYFGFKLGSQEGTIDLKKALGLFEQECPTLNEARGGRAR